MATSSNIDSGPRAALGCVAIAVLSQRGKIILIWKRVNGEWMIAHDMFNLDGTAAASNQ
jgi:hypothetical protein